METTIEVLTKDLQEMQKERETTRELLVMYNGTIQYLTEKIKSLAPKPDSETDKNPNASKKDKE